MGENRNFILKSQETHKKGYDQIGEKEMGAKQNKSSCKIGEKPIPREPRPIALEKQDLQNQQFTSGGNRKEKELW